MKKMLIHILLFFLSFSLSFAQTKQEAEIRKLDKLEIEAIHKGDTATLFKLWAKNYVVNNPYGEIVTIKEILGFIRAGQIDYSFVERITERVTFTENVAIAMGKEVVKPQNATADAGKTIIRRYTHIWLNTKGAWHLIARQATNFSIE